MNVCCAQTTKNVMHVLLKIATLPHLALVWHRLTQLYRNLSRFTAQNIVAVACLRYAGLLVKVVGGQRGTG